MSRGMLRRRQDGGYAAGGSRWPPDAGRVDGGAEETRALQQPPLDAQTHEQLTITRQGSPAAVLVAADEWQALQDTLFWLSRGAADDVEAGQTEHAAGETWSVDAVRHRFGAPTQ